jgi:hypothetical protein
MVLGTSLEAHAFPEAGPRPTDTDNPWSVLDTIVAESSRTYALATLKRAINRRLVEITQGRQPFKPSALKPDEMSRSYAHIIANAHNSRDFSLALDPKPTPSPFVENMHNWARLHMKACPDCHWRFFSSTSDFLSGNGTNPCWVAPIISMAHNGFVVPLCSVLPPEFSFPNAPNLGQALSAVNKEFDRMTDEDNIRLGPISHRSPLLLVLKDSDVQSGMERLRAADLAPQASLAKDVDELNRQLEPLEPPANKPIKARLAVNYSKRGGLNDVICRWPFRSVSIHDALELVFPGCWMGKLDLSRCFNSIPRHPSQWRLFGIRFRDQDWQVPRLLFGESEAPAAASTLTAFLSDVLWAHGIPNRIVMDDIFVVGASHDECLRHMDDAARIARMLGWRDNTDKREGPSQSLIFLGLLINSRTMRLSIPPVKLTRLLTKIQDFRAKSRVSIKELQSLANSLEHAPPLALPPSLSRPQATFSPALPHFTSCPT